MAEAILVTGGAGFIGSAFVRHQLSTTERIVLNVDALTYAGSRETLAAVAGHPRHVFVHADISDVDAMRGLLITHRPRAVVHLAAETHVDRSIDNAEAFVHSNVLGTYRLLETVLEYWNTRQGPERNTFRFVHVSTDEVYGSLGDTGAFDESTPYAPSSPYAASKASSDHFVGAWHKTYDFPGVITHSSNNYGPFQFPEKLIPHFISLAVAGRPLPVYGTGENVRDWLHVDDHVRALERASAVGVPGATYNIASGHERTTVDVARAICAALDDLQPDPRGKYERLIAFVTDRPGHDYRYAMRTEKSREQLGWSAEVSFDDGLRNTVAWYLHNAEWMRRALAGSYQGDRLGVRGLSTERA